MLILISAMTRDRVIGKANGLPWKIPEEYAQFLAHVRGYPVILGRTSFEIFGADLDRSPLLVVSRSLGDRPEVEVCRSFPEALERAAAHDARIFCGGGASIYRLALPRADALYLSMIKRDHEGDTKFPEFDEADWTITRREDHAEFEFRIYERRRPSR